MRIPTYLYNIEATDGRFQLLMPLFLLAIMRLQFVTWALAPSAPSAYVMRAIPYDIVVTTE